MPRSSKIIYLTFDDGPLPTITPRVLNMLELYQAKATFFCVGDNVRKYPDVLAQVVAAGHRLGNHTYHHLEGTKTDTEAYLQNTASCQQLLNRFLVGGEQPLFRPPYGRFKKKQREQLQQDYRIVMWDVLPADFDQSLTAEECLSKSIRYTRPGSIVVFHDSQKAWERLQLVLPAYLQHFYHQGYTFAAL